MTTRFAGSIAAIVLALTAPLPGQVEADSFESRRENLLEVLTEPGLMGENQFSGGYLYRRAWQHYTAHLARGTNLAEANHYFATSDEIESGEWPALAYVRTYLKFKDTRLEPPASERLRGVLDEYWQTMEADRYEQRLKSYGTNGNHSITAFSTYLLLEQAFGPGRYHDLVVEKYQTWVQHQGRFGRDEVNSPHYLDRSLIPLLNLYDFSEDANVRLWAQMAIDQMVADFALLSLKNVRGGPWVRAHHRHSPFVAEINDGTHDSFYVAGYALFGGSPTPAYVFTEQIMNYVVMATTDYRAPEVVADIADSGRRGSYEVKSRPTPVKTSPLTSSQTWDMYYYITPAYSLSSLQDRVELDNQLTNANYAAPDYVNTQVWELTFSHPKKILGPMRNLWIRTGSVNNIAEPNNPNTAIMQYKNVLFYQGHFMDYNRNLHEDGGWYEEEGVMAGGGPRGRRETAKTKSLHFWRVRNPEGDVFVGITNYPSLDAGIVEVGLADNFGGFEEFKAKIRSAESSCEPSGQRMNYTSTNGDRIAIDEGEASVNGTPWPLHGYPLYDSPFINSALGSGVIEISNDGKRLTLDFRDRTDPIRRETP